MKILAPVNTPAEIVPIVKAGAEELYCGIMPDSWRNRYTNMASMNRREWKVSNIKTLEDFHEIIKMAHDNGARVFMTMNALYTESQHPTVIDTFHKAKEFGVDAFIVADIGILIALQQEGFKADIHISTGGTTFNNATAAFYKSFGATRIIIPRHIMIAEAIEMATNDRSMEFEVFILNRGCKNIDGFCTFQHGVNEVRVGKLWDIPKRMNWDQKILNILRQLPKSVAEPIARCRMFGSVGACFLSYDVTPLTENPQPPLENRQIAQKNVRNTFNLLTGVDTCGACRLGELMAQGIASVKIVGRENLTPKKLQDVSFLNRVRSYFLEHGSHSGFQSHQPHIRKMYKEIYGFDCGMRCYYPD